MLALTLTEPWATLMALEEKKWETRSWHLPSRVLGQSCAIHAAKGYPGWASRLTEAEPFCSSLRTKGNAFLPNLTRGKILCIVKFVECVRTEVVLGQISLKEMEFGNYDKNRFAFRSEFVGRLAEPVSVTGHLGFWEYPLDDGADWNYV